MRVMVELGVWPSIGSLSLVPTKDVTRGNQWTGLVAPVQLGLIPQSSGTNGEPMGNQWKIGEPMRIISLL